MKLSEVEQRWVDIWNDLFDLEARSGQSSAKISRKCGDYTMIEYKGYLGVFDFDPEIDAFHGTVINTNDVISFYGSSVTELREEMQKSIEAYLEFCQEQGKEPEEPFSGTLIIQTSPELHRRIALNAARHHVNLNTYLQEVLEKGIAAE